MKCNSLTAVIRGSGGRSLAGSGIEVPSRGKAFLSIKNHYMYCFKQVFRTCLALIAKHRTSSHSSTSKREICPPPRRVPHLHLQHGPQGGGAELNLPQERPKEQGQHHSRQCHLLSPVPSLPPGSPGNLPARQVQPPCKPDP